jgi:hypothetical protein
VRYHKVIRYRTLNVTYCTYILGCVATRAETSAYRRLANHFLKCPTFDHRPAWNSPIIGEVTGHSDRHKRGGSASSAAHFGFSIQQRRVATNSSPQPDIPAFLSDIGLLPVLLLNPTSGPFLLQQRRVATLTLPLNPTSTHQTTFSIGVGNAGTAARQ